MTGVSFDDLVTVATVGTARKGLTVSELAGPAAGQAAVLDRGDPAAALLDAAALLTVARRAGGQPAAEVPAPAAAAAGGPGDGSAGGAERELPPRAVRLLRQLGAAEGGRGVAAADPAILAELLTAAGRAGFVLPAPLLPSLLDAAVRDSAVRPAVGTVLGARGRWLAGYRAQWQRAVYQARATGIAVGDDAGDGTGTGTAGTSTAGTSTAGTSTARTGRGSAARTAAGAADTAEAELAAWRTGNRDARRALLAEARRRDPAAGRELLRAGWQRETAFDRAALLYLLRHGLSAADEEFLEAALDDRASGVRDEARQLLGWLPGSAFRERAAARAAPLLRVERRGLRRHLTVTLPGEPDAAALRDGVPAASPFPGIGEGAWRLIHVLAGAPLASWRQLGLAPDSLVALPVTEERAAHVHAAWRRAVAREREAAGPSGPGAVTAGAGGAQGSGGGPEGAELTAWALALLSDGTGHPAKWPPSVWPDDAALAAALPADVRADRAAALLKAARPDDRSAAYWVTAEVTACASPWPSVLADAVAGVIIQAGTRPELPALPRALLRVAGRSLPAAGPRDYAAALTQLAAARPQDWSPLLQAAAETVTLRRAFLAELSSPG